MDIITHIEDTTEIKRAINFTMAVCNFNATPFKEMAESYVNKYSNLTFTEEDIRDVKKIIADLNKKAKEFDDARKDVKKKFNEPLVAFETEINSVSSIYLQALTLLKTKVQSYEYVFMNNKIEEIKPLISQVISENEIKEPFASELTILDSYLNKTTTMRQITTDLTRRANEILLRQRNAELKAIADAEKAERRITLVANLNEKYLGRLITAISYAKVKDLTDEEIVNYFERAAASYAEMVKSKPDQTFTYHCEISYSGSEDLILTYLQKMKQQIGANIIVHKKEIK